MPEDRGFSNINSPPMRNDHLCGAEQETKFSERNEKEREREREGVRKQRQNEKRIVL